MPSASLSDFPAELLVQVYKSLDNVKDITALNLVTHQFYDLWLSNTLSISDAVFSRTVKSYHHARELVKLQQKVLERDHCDDDGHHDPYRRALERNKLIISNATGFHVFYEAKKQVSPEEIHLETYYGLCRLILAEELPFAESSCLALLNSEIVRIMYSVVYHYPEDHAQAVLTGLLDEVHTRFGVGIIDGKFPGDIVECLWKILVEHVRALERAEVVGNGVENV
ncbi:hypothetical protein JMJ35_002752 [Cladonia borealis]|uniref:F-box domain-containing protein n=1 Tax=Cladonia borealis TaxID=184061 RepID=A0AA39R5R3_9LECA|nr:hypothetical protein JMJ35_002752 [Cladonia borealis]